MNRMSASSVILFILCILFILSNPFLDLVGS